MAKSILKKGSALFLSFLLPLVIILLTPFDLNLKQAIILAAVILVVTWWAFKIVHTSIASALLVVFFLIFSGAPAASVLKFPLSEIFVLLIAATLISEGIIKSGLSTRISVFFLNKYGTTGYRLAALPFIIDLILMFLIPQPFPRVILLAAIYSQFLTSKNLDQRTSSVLLFGVFTATTATSMFFLNGDILLNNLALEFAGVSMTWFQWALYMFVPSLVICAMMFSVFVLIFRKEIKAVKFDPIQPEKTPLSSSEKLAAAILAIVIIFWMSEAAHGISPAIVSAAGVVMLFGAGLLKLQDLKKINIQLVIFLTAAFSIGGVMAHTGTAGAIFDFLVQYLPAYSSPLYFPFLILTVMILHMVIGSTVTTMAVALPGIVMITSGAVPASVAALVVYTAANLHYLLPFQHVVIMIGAGKNYYDSRHVLKFGLCLTVLVFIAVLLVQIPWWRLLNLL